MYVCMYVCMCVCMYVRRYVCMYVCMYFYFVITRYYEMIAVKVNAYFKKKSTNSYSSFQTYERTHFNEPYVAAVFDRAFVNDGFSTFTLGKTMTNFVNFF